ncbi:MAG: M56 family metallopeptidase [Bacteroidia bacterium]|nr:M56 family metallopeptidase [Bacteroidia bacterium]
MITQLIQASAIITIALLFYRFLLEKETHYKLNRWVLISCMLAAIFLPQIQFEMSVPQEISLPFPLTESNSLEVESQFVLPAEEAEGWTNLEPAPLREEAILPIEAENAVWTLLSSYSWDEYLFFIYVLGAAFMFARFLVQMFSLIHHIQILPKNKDGKYIIVQLNRGKASYSFFNFIFINPQPLDHSTYQQILSHERIHVDQRHSVDILLSEFLVIFQWFNPFAWIYKKKIKQNLEYLTDDEMVRKGTDKTAYQFSLLRVSAPGASSQLVLNYSQSLLKKRILMMNTKKSSLLSVWKYAFLLPLLALSSIVLVAERAPEFADLSPLLFEEQETEYVETNEAEILLEEETPKSNIVSETKDLIPANFPSLTVSTEAIEGNWEAKLKEDELCLRIIREISENDWNWMHFDCYEHSDFSPRVTTSTTSFSMSRKAGKLNFTGSFSGEKGEGSFQFEGSDSYRRDLASKGVRKASDDLMFRLFFVRNEEKFVANLVELQKLGLDEKSLETLMVDGVKADLVKGYQDAGLAVGDHIAFIRSRVKADLIKSYNDAGLDLEKHKSFINSRVKPKLLASYNDAGLDLEEHKNFINGRVPAQLLKDYKAAGYDLEESKNFISSRVKPDLLKAYEAEGLDLTAHRPYIISRVKPGLLAAYKDAGYDLEEQKRFIQSRVKPDLLKAYENAGMDLEENKSYIMSRLKPDLLQAYKDAGFDLEESKSFIQARVKPASLVEYRDAGLDLEEHERFIQSRVPVALIKEYNDAGYDLDTYKSYIQSRIHAKSLKAYDDAGFDLETHKSFIQNRVKPELLQSYKDAGLDVDKYKSYINSRVPSSYLTEYRKAGYDLEEYKKYIHNRVKASFLKEYEKAGLDHDKYSKFISSRVSADFLKQYMDAGYDPMKHTDFIQHRIRASRLKSYEDAGLDIEKHKDFIMDRVSPQTVLKYRESQKKN